MGFYDYRCSITGVSLKGANAALVLLAKRGRRFRPISLPLHGTYNRFGTIDGIKKTAPNAKVLFKWLSAQHKSGALVIDEFEAKYGKVSTLEGLLMLIERNVTQNEDAVLYRGERVWYTLISQVVWDAVVARSKASVARAEGLFAELFRESPVAQEIYQRRLTTLGEPIAELAAVDRFLAAARRTWRLSDGGEQHFAEEMRAFLEAAEKRSAGFPAIREGLVAYRKEVADLLVDEDDDVPKGDAEVGAKLAGKKQAAKATRSSRKKAAAGGRGGSRAAKAYLDQWRRNAREAWLKAWKLDRAEPLPKLPAAVKEQERPAEAVVLGSPGAKSLAQAIAAVPAGGCIVVPAGVYRQTTAVDTSKPFELVGSGAARSVVVFAPGDDDAVSLSGKGSWVLRGLSLLIDSAKKHKGGDVLNAFPGARVEAQQCLFGGAVAIEHDGEQREGGCSVRAYDGGRIVLRDCHLVASSWGGAAHDKGARLDLEGGAVYLCDFGLFAGSGGRIGARSTVVATCRHGAKSYGRTARVELRQCKVLDSLNSAAYAQSGTMQLEECTIDDAGGHGIGSEAAAAVIARGCQVNDGWCCGAAVAGRVTLEGNSFRRNREHGIELQATSKGLVTANRCIDNDELGIFWHPKSRAKLVGNKTRSFDPPGKPRKILKRDVVTNDTKAVRSVDIAPLTRVPKGLPASWQQALVADDPVEHVLRHLWRPWQSLLPKTFRAFEAALRHVALLQIRDEPASLLYVFEGESDRHFYQGYPPRHGRHRLAQQLPRELFDLHSVHDGLIDTFVAGMQPSFSWHDLVGIVSDDGDGEIVPGVSCKDFLVVASWDARYLGFDLTKTPARCLRWHPREDAEEVSNVVEHIDAVIAQEVEELAE